MNATSHFYSKPYSARAALVAPHGACSHKALRVMLAIFLATELQSTLFSQQTETNPSPADSAGAQTQSVSRPKNVADELLLAERFQFGNGVPKDMPQSIYWYRKAADHGDPSAQIQLGYFYFKGIGVERDPVESARWFARAVGTGSPTAKLNLAVLYLRGAGVPRDPELAFAFLDDLAAKGNPRAEAYLGIMYQNGLGVAQDQATAEKWFAKAAKGNSPEGQFGMGVLYSTAPQHEHDFRRAADFLRRSAQAGYVPSMHSLGVLLLDHPEIARRRPDEALTLLTRAAEAGSWRASALLGFLCRDGRAVSRDASESLRWFTIAVRQGGSEAESSLSRDVARSQELLSAGEQERVVQSVQNWLADHPAPNSLFARADSGQHLPQ